MFLQSLSPLPLDMLLLGAAEVLWEGCCSLDEIQTSQSRCILQACLIFASQKGKRNLNASVYLLFGTIKCHWREHLENFSGCAAKKNCNKLCPLDGLVTLCLHKYIRCLFENSNIQIETSTHLNINIYIHTLCIFIQTLNSLLAQMQLGAQFIVFL